MNSLHNYPALPWPRVCGHKSQASFKNSNSGFNSVSLESSQLGRVACDSANSQWDLDLAESYTPILSHIWLNLAMAESELSRTQPSFKTIVSGD